MHLRTLVISRMSMESARRRTVWPQAARRRAGFTAFFSTRWVFANQSAAINVLRFEGLYELVT